MKHRNNPVNGKNHTYIIYREGPWNFSYLKNTDSWLDGRIRGPQDVLSLLRSVGTTVTLLAAEERGPEERIVVPWAIWLQEDGPGLTQC